MPDFSSPFRPGGPMITLLGSSTNSGSATFMPMQGDWALLAYNRGPFDAYLSYGPNSSAVASAALPAVGAGVPNIGGANLLPMPVGSVQTFTFAGPTFLGIVIPIPGNALVDLSAGDGS